MVATHPCASFRFSRLKLAFGEINFNRSLIILKPCDCLLAADLFEGWDILLEEDKPPPLSSTVITRNSSSLSAWNVRVISGIPFLLSSNPCQIAFSTKG